MTGPFSRGLLFGLGLLLVSACGGTRGTSATPNEAWACPALPSGFDESWLIGRWQAEYGAAVDIIELSDDHTYKQRYERTAHGLQFQNGPNSWTLEAGPGGGFYLHLSRMRRCDDTDELCANPTGGSGERYWFDFCGGRFVQMPDEVILLVSGAPEVEGITPPPDGIVLRHMAINSSSGSYHFVRVQP